MRSQELASWNLGGELASWQISTELKFRAEINPRQLVKSVLSVFSSAESWEHGLGGLDEFSNISGLPKAPSEERLSGVCLVEPRG